MIRHLPTEVTIAGGGSSLEQLSDSALDYIVSDIVVDINVNEIAVHHRKTTFVWIFMALFSPTVLISLYWATAL